MNKHIHSLRVREDTSRHVEVCSLRKLQMALQRDPSEPSSCERDPEKVGTMKTAAWQVSGSRLALLLSVLPELRL